MHVYVCDDAHIPQIIIKFIIFCSIYSQSVRVLTLATHTHTHPPHAPSKKRKSHFFHSYTHSIQLIQYVTTNCDLYPNLGWCLLSVCGHFVKHLQCSPMATKLPTTREQFTHNHLSSFPFVRSKGSLWWSVAFLVTAVNPVLYYIHVHVQTQALGQESRSSRKAFEVWCIHTIPEECGLNSLLTF